MYMSRKEVMMPHTWWWLNVVAMLVVGVCFVCGEPSDLENELRVLNKQVTTLLDRRREDLESIEGNLRKQLFQSPELVKVQEELQALR